MEEYIPKRKNLIEKIVKNQFVMLLTSMILVVIVITGSSYAIFNKNNITELEDVIVSVGNLEAVISSDSNTINLSYENSGEDDYSGSSRQGYTFNVSNTGDTDINYYELRLMDKEYEISTLPHKAIRFTINRNKGDYIVPTNLADNYDYIFASGPLSVGETDTFTLKLWIDENASVNMISNKVSHLSLELTLYQEKPTDKYIFYDENGGDGFVPKTRVSSRKISSLVPVRVGYIFIGWNTDAEANVALYESNDNYEESRGTILYAIWKQGSSLYDATKMSLSSCLLASDNDARIVAGTSSNVNNNYVWYSGKLWRIVSLNDDGTIKLVSEDNITEIRYGTNITFSYSEVYQWLNQEFLHTLFNYDNMIVTDYAWNATATTGTGKPAKTTLVSTPVGLLNAYEYVSSYNGASSATGYLFMGYYSWLLNGTSSPYVREQSYSGSLNSANYGSLHGVRPSIVLKKGIKFLDGDGSVNNPYTLYGDISTPINGVTRINTRISGEWVIFNSELYRIVDIEQGKAKLVKYIKLEVSDKMFASTVYWRKSGNINNSEYFDYYLNNNWYDSLSDTNKEMITNGIWYLGLNANTTYKSTICASPSNGISAIDCEKTTSTWTGLIGLSRYGELFSSQIGDGYGTSTSSHSWLITPYNSTTSKYSASNGYVTSYEPSATRTAKPSFFLSENVKITSGLGTKNSPFEIGL